MISKSLLNPTQQLLLRLQKNEMLETSDSESGSDKDYQKHASSSPFLKLFAISKTYSPLAPLTRSISDIDLKLVEGVFRKRI